MNKLLTLIIISCSFFFAGQVKAATVMMDYNEMGSVLAYASNAGTAIATTTKVRTGAYSLYLAGNGSVVQVRGVNADGNQTGSATYDTIYARYCINVTTFPATRNDIFTAVSAGVAVKFQITLSSTGQLEFWNHSLVGVGSSTDGFIQADTDTCFFVSVGSGASGAWEVRDSSMNIIGSGTTDLMSNLNSSVRVGTFSNATGEAYDIYVDDIIVNDADYPPLGGTAIMKPNADGTYQDFGKSSGTDGYSLVNTIPVSVSTYVQKTAATGTIATSTFDLDSTATAGISGTINAIKVTDYGRGIRNFGSNAFGIYDGSNWETSTYATWGTTSSYRSLIFDTCPNGSACTISVLDSIQLGAISGSGTAEGNNRTAEIMLMVDFTPSVTPPATSGGFIWIEDI